MLRTKISKKHAKEIALLLEKEKLLSLTLPPFWRRLFKAYYREKTNIEIHIGYTGYLEEQIVEIANDDNHKPIIKRIIQGEIAISQVSIENFNPSNVSPGVNLISPDIFRTFPDCKCFQIRTTPASRSLEFGRVCYPFNMYQFLEVIIQSLSWETFEISHILEDNKGLQSITGYNFYANRKSWIKQIWESSSGSLIKAYRSKQLSIHFESYTTDHAYARLNNSTVTKFVITRHITEETQY